MYDRVSVALSLCSSHRTKRRRNTFSHRFVKYSPLYDCSRALVIEPLDKEESKDKEAS